jgi:hypothetical protein
MRGPGEIAVFPDTLWRVASQRGTYTSDALARDAIAISASSKWRGAM